MGLFRKAVVLTAMLLGTMQLEAQVVLPPIFNCNMVLQKGIEIPVSGMGFAWREGHSNF